MENTGSQRNVNDYNLGFYEKNLKRGLVVKDFGRQKINKIYNNLK